MRRYEIIRHSQRIMRGLIWGIGLCTLLLFGGQYMILGTDDVANLSRISRLEGKTLPKWDSQLMAGAGAERVYDVRLSGYGEGTDLVRIYLDGHLLHSLTAGETKQLAAEAHQVLTADGSLLETPLSIEICVAGETLLPVTVIYPGQLIALPWENGLEK